MPSKLAAFLCIICIFAALRLEYKRSANTTFALWIPIIWMMYCGSRPLGYWFNTGGRADVISGSPIDKVFLSLFILTGLIVLSKRTIDWRSILENNKIILILYIYFGISIFWSDFMGVSFKRWIRTIGDLIMVLVVITEPEPRDAIERMFRSCAYVLIPLSVLFIKYFPDIGRRYHHHLGYTIWTGVTTNKNSLGQLCFVVAFFILWIIIRKWLKKELFNDKKQLVIDVVLLSISIWLLIGPGQARSATSFGVFFIGICCFIVAAKFRSKQQYFGIFIFISVIILLFSQFVIDVFYNKSLLESAVAASGRDMTFTGRILIWRDLLELNSNTPWFGKGYGAFWLGDLTSDLWEEYQVNQGHNGYIDVYVDIGLVGVFIIAGAIISGYLNSMNTFLRDYELGGFKMGYLVMICIYNITESTFIKPTNLLWFIFLLISIGYPQTNTDVYERKPVEPRELGP